MNSTVHDERTEVDDVRLGHACVIVAGPGYADVIISEDVFIEGVQRVGARERMRGCRRRVGHG
jgi:hypothetical protein